MNLPEPVDEFLRRLPPTSRPWPRWRLPSRTRACTIPRGTACRRRIANRCGWSPAYPRWWPRSAGCARGRHPILPNAELSLAANFLWMLTGRLPTADETQAMNLILILHAEHSLNASTFAARVITATLTGRLFGGDRGDRALKGPLHGGANTAVLKTLEEIGSVEQVGPWFDAALARKEKFMGFGHAVYKTKDPRVKHLKEVSRRLGIDRGDTRLFDISVELEEPRDGRHREALQRRLLFGQRARRAGDRRRHVHVHLSRPAESSGGVPTSWSSLPTTKSSALPPSTWARRTAVTCRSRTADRTTRSFAG